MPAAPPPRTKTPSAPSAARWRRATPRVLPGPPDGLSAGAEAGRGRGVRTELCKGEKRENRNQEKGTEEEEDEKEEENIVEERGRRSQHKLPSI